MSGALDRASSWLDLVADPVRVHILRSLSKVPEATASELAASGHASDTTLRRHLDALATIGVLEEFAGESDGQTAGRPATRFRLQADVRESLQLVFGHPR